MNRSINLLIDGIDIITHSVPAHVLVHPARTAKLLRGVYQANWGLARTPDGADENQKIIANDTVKVLGRQYGVTVNCSFLFVFLLVLGNASLTTNPTLESISHLVLVHDIVADSKLRGVVNFKFVTGDP